MRFAGRISGSDPDRASRARELARVACGGRPVLGKALADTGALLAYLDGTDRWHGACRSALPAFRLPLVTSTAVLTELFHLVGDSRHERRVAWDFVRSGVLTVATLSDRDLPDLEALMRRYRDRRMDFADATLVVLAERESLSTVFTVDHDDFETYRIGARERFRVLPPRSG